MVVKNKNNIIFLDERQDYSVVKIYNKCGIVDKYGNHITDVKYDFVGSRMNDKKIFHNGFAIVTLNGKKGFVDTTGKEICEIKYKNCFDFSNGFACVSVGNNKFGIINEYGKEICDPKYQSVGTFVNGFAKVTKNCKVGFINMKGEEVGEIKYQYCGNFNNGYSFVILDTYEEAFINTDGVEGRFFKSIGNIDLNNSRLNSAYIGMMDGKIIVSIGDQIGDMNIIIKRIGNCSIPVMDRIGLINKLKKAI